MMDKNDIRWMRCAIEQAKLGFGLTSPNPIVGAVVVKDGQLIGQGYHHKAGTPHAEPNALDDALRNAPGAVKGATLYVTSSPCMECSKLIIQSGISRVVYKDEYRLDDGINLLRRAGVEVVKLGEDE